MIVKRQNLISIKMCWRFLKQKSFNLKTGMKHFKSTEKREARRLKSNKN